MLLLLYPTSHSLPILQFKYTKRASLTVNINKTKCFTVDVNVYFIVLAFILNTLKGHTSYKEMKSLQEHRRKKKKSNFEPQGFLQNILSFASVLSCLLFLNSYSINVNQSFFTYTEHSPSFCLPISLWNYCSLRTTCVGLDRVNSLHSSGYEGFGFVLKNMLIIQLF